MKKEKTKLFAIYKNNHHLGNEAGENVCDAIKKYIKASLFTSFLDDEEFMAQYSGKIAVKNIHY